KQKPQGWLGIMEFWCVPWATRAWSKYRFREYQWVFELLDRARQYGGEEEHAIIGVLLGYSGDAIEQYLHDVCRPDPEGDGRR
nr:hypothetical protein [Candidatus Sigynarchaeota archaeon]